jgi:hypothetical protein
MPLPCRFYNIMKLLTILPLWAYFTISGAAGHTNLRRTQSFPPLEEICEIVAASPKAKGLCHAYEEKSVLMRRKILRPPAP